MNAAAEALYPVKVYHKGHIAFRAKTNETMKPEDIIYPSGRHPEKDSPITCFTCGSGLNLMGIIAGLWKAQ